jgi:hypothetical protein
MANRAQQARLSQPPKFKNLVLVKPYRIELGEGNWVEVTEHKTAGNHRDYLRELFGGLVNPNKSSDGVFEVDAGAVELALVRSRLMDWHIVQDGKTISFDKAILDDFDPAVVSYLAQAIGELDGTTTADLGLDDPNG